jgi:putative peptidoglycan lipid II flippase
MTRSALVAYAVGLAGIILVKVLAPGFYARQNIRTPVKVAIATLVITQVANIVLVPWLRHAGLAAAISVGATFNAAWLWILMRRSGAYQPAPGWGAFLLKVAVALYMMGGVIWYGMGSEQSWFAITAGARALKLAAIILGAMAVYFATLWAVGFRLQQFVRHS